MAVVRRRPRRRRAPPALPTAAAVAATLVTLVLLWRHNSRLHTVDGRGSGAQSLPASHARQGQAQGQQEKEQQEVLRPWLQQAAAAEAEEDWDDDAPEVLAARAEAEVAPPSMPSPAIIVFAFNRPALGPLDARGRRGQGQGLHRARGQPQQAGGGSRNIGEVGANMDRTAFRRYLKNMAFAKTPVRRSEWGDLSYLLQPGYSERMRRALAGAEFRASAIPPPNATLLLPGARVLVADRRFCPLLPPGPLAIPPSAGLAPLAARRNESCLDACGAAGMHCSAPDFWFLNTCAALKAAFPCESGCTVEIGPDIPAYVPDPGAQLHGYCLVTQKSSRCGARHAGTARLCACVPGAEPAAAAAARLRAEAAAERRDALAERQRQRWQARHDEEAAWQAALQAAQQAGVAASANGLGAADSASPAGASGLLNTLAAAQAAAAVGKQQREQQLQQQAQRLEERAAGDSASAASTSAKQAGSAPLHTVLAAQVAAAAQQEQNQQQHQQLQQQDGVARGSTLTPAKQREAPLHTLLAAQLATAAAGQQQQQGRQVGGTDGAAERTDNAAAGPSPALHTLLAAQVAAASSG
eukprot:scaffold3.g6242.t1